MIFCIIQVDNQSLPKFSNLANIISFACHVDSRKAGLWLVWGGMCLGMPPLHNVYNMRSLLLVSSLMCLDPVSFSRILSLSHRPLPGCHHRPLLKWAQKFAPQLDKHYEVISRTTATIQSLATLLLGWPPIWLDTTAQTMHKGGFSVKIQDVTIRMVAKG